MHGCCTPVQDKTFRGTTPERSKIAPSNSPFERGRKINLVMIRKTYYHRWYIVAGVVLVFILTQAGLWGFYFHQVDLWEESLGDHLQNMAILAGSRMADIPENLWISNPEIFKNIIKPFRDTGLVEDCFLLDKNGEWISGLIDDVSGFNPVLELDREAINIALAGITTRTNPYLIADLYFQNVYTPVIGSSGDISAVLGVKAKSSSYEWFYKGKIILIFISLINVLVFLFLGIAYWRLSGNMLKLESAIAQTENLAAMGRMSASVAHEIRNPLGIIEQTVSLLRRRYDREGKDEVFDYIPEEVDRLNKLIEEFLEFAKGGKPKREKFDLALLIKDTVQVLEPEMESIDIDLKIPESMDVSADMSQIKSVLLNLLYNSKDALPEGGKISISLKKDSDEWILVVSDNGIGMDANILEAATEPFYTTKEKGVGLGLSIVRMIVENHDGTINIKSEPQKGTEIKLRIKS